MPNSPEIQLFEGKFFEKVNWNHVFYFTVIASTGSMRAAAKILDLQPSTLSEQISTLEKTLKINLFNRKMKRLTLTEEGQKLYRYSKTMFETGQRLLDVISPSSVGQYPITVGISPSATAPQVFECLINFSTAQSENRVRINRWSHDEMEHLMLESKLDFGFTDRKTERKDVVQQCIYQGKTKFFASKELEGVGLADAMKSRALFICRSGASQFSVVETLLDTYNLQPKTIISSEYVSLVYRAAETGAGIAALSEENFGSRYPNLVELTPPKGFPDLSEQVYLSWAAGSENSASVRALKTFLQSSLKLVS